VSLPEHHISKAYSFRVPDSKLREHRILFGTNTTDGGQNYLQIARLQVPDFSVPDPARYNENTGEIGGWGDAPKPFHFEIVQRINHPSEVNKARYMPQNPNIIGSMGVGGAVLVFDRTKHPLTPKDNEIHAEIELTGHTDEGYGMSWNSVVEGQLVTASQDQTVRLWDLTANPSASSNGLPATRIFKHHHAIVNDVEFHPQHSFFLASVSDDHTLQVVDTRQQDDEQAAIRNVTAHNDAVNCVTWHPKWEWIMATGSADRTVAIWDLRNMKEKLHSIENAVKDSVIKLEFNPQDQSILAAGSYDRRIVMLDLSRTGEEQTAEEAEEGPPEL
jgi:histone-binding protein RBBP4